MTTNGAHRAIDAVWRIESARLIAGLARLVRDVGIAGELAQDALVAALEQWPESGVPQNPGAWLMAAAKHRAIDHLRRSKRIDRMQEVLGRSLTARLRESAVDLDAALDDEVGDDLLRLIFTACHPVLAPEARVALTLRLLGGLTTDEIARAFLVPASTVAQRIVRAKRTLADEQVPFEVPRGAELAVRLGSVLEVIYLVYNEGYAATSGDDWMRTSLCEEALRLGRILGELVPAEPEVWGLVALMEIQSSRAGARAGPAGEPILLPDQDRSRWNRTLIRRGLAALARAEQLGGAWGPYALQAAIAACHARASTHEETDWARIAALYAAFAHVISSPVIELNREVAVSMAYGPAASLELVERLGTDPIDDGLSPLAERPGRSPHQARSPRRSPPRLRAGRVAHAQRPGARTYAAPSPVLRSGLDAGRPSMRLHLDRLCRDCRTRSSRRVRSGIVARRTISPVRFLVDLVCVTFPGIVIPCRRSSRVVLRRARWDDRD